MACGQAATLPTKKRLSNPACREFQEARIGAGGRAEAHGNLCHFPVNDPHGDEFRKQAPVSLLQNKSDLPSIPSHGAPPLSAARPAGVGPGFPPQCPSVCAPIASGSGYTSPRVINSRFSDVGGRNSFPEAFVTTFDHHVALGKILQKFREFLAAVQRCAHLVGVRTGELEKHVGAD